MTMIEKRLMKAYFQAAHPDSTDKDEGAMILQKDFGLEFIGAHVGGMQSMPYSGTIPDSLASLRRLPAAMGNEDELRLVYGLVLISKPKTKRVKKPE